MPSQVRDEYFPRIMVKFNPGAPQSIHVSWSSPQLPPWLTWQNGVLMGVPGSGDVTQGVDVVVEAAVSVLIAISLTS
jgi:hypothetical protein